MAEFSYRQAGLEDAAEIHTFLLALAPEIPLLVERLEDEERLYALIRNCARSGESWIAVNEAGRIVGFALVEPAQLRRHYAEGEALELRYVGAAPDCRERGVITGLLDKVLARMLPVAISVNPLNRSGIAGHLQQLGFQQIEVAGGEHRLRWDPGASP